MYVQNRHIHTLGHIHTKSTNNLPQIFTDVLMFTQPYTCSAAYEYTHSNTYLGTNIKKYMRIYSNKPNHTHPHAT